MKTRDLRSTPEATHHESPTPSSSLPVSDAPVRAEVSLFSRLTIRTETAYLDDVLPPSTLGLAAYLLTHAARAHTRDELIDRFWPGLAPDAGRRRLSQALWRIAQRCDAAGITSLFDNSASTVRVSARYLIRTDVAEFERLIDGGLAAGGRSGDAGERANELRSALERYTGDFVANCFEEWPISERRRLHLRYRTALLEYTRLLKAKSLFNEALEQARLLVASDPLDEEAYCEAMRLAFLANRRKEAVDLFHECVGELHHELGIEPAPSTLELFASIDAAAPTPAAAGVTASTAPAPVSDRAATAPFLAREVECERFFERVDRMMAGHGGTLLVDGDAGVGKTRLLAECAVGARWRGATVWQGSHRRSTAPVPFRGLIEALAPSLHGLRGEQLAEVVGGEWVDAAMEIFELGLTPGRPMAGPAVISTEVRWQRCEALAQLLLAQGAVGPTVVMLDDVQWMDHDSIEVLAQLGRRLADSSVLLVLSYRHDEALANQRLWDELRKIESVHARRIRIEELAPPDAMRLAAWAADGQGEVEALEGVVGRTGGNPLFIIETMRAIGTPEVAYGPQIPIAATVSDVVQQRLECAPAPVAEVLEILAVAKTSLNSAQVAAVGGRPRREVISALAAAQQSGFIVETDHGMMFGHEVVRRAVYLATSRDQRRRLHAALAKLLADGELAVEEVAEHAARGGDWAQAFRYFAQAADRALTLGAFKTSSEHSLRARRSHELAGLDRQALVPLLLAHEQVLDVLSERRRQRDALDLLDAISDDERTAIEVLRRRAALAANTGDAGDAVDHATEAVTRSADADVLRSEALIGLGVALMSAGAAGDAIEPLQQAIQTGQDVHALTEAHNALGRAMIMVQDLAGAQEHLAQALAISSSAGDARSQVDALGALGVLAIETGDHAAAEEQLALAVSKANDLGYRRGAAVSLVNLASMFAVSGRSGVSLGLYDEALASFRIVRERRGEAMVLANRAMIGLRLGLEVEALATDVRRAARYFIEIGDLRHRSMCLDTLANIDRRVRHTASARRNLRRALEFAEQAGDEWFGVQILRSTAQLELEARRPEIALEAIERARLLSTERAFAGLLPSVLVVESGVRQALGQRTVALGLAEQAAARLTDHSDSAASVALWAAQALEAAGAEPSAIAGMVLRADRLMRRELDGMDDASQQHALANGVEPIAIAELVERFIIQTETHQLSARESTTGTETVVVELTVTHPDDHRLRSKAGQRRARLLRVINEASARGAILRTAELAALVGASLATVKRDLNVLRADGHELGATAPDTVADRDDVAAPALRRA